MDYPIVSSIEKAIANKVDKLVTTNDANFKTIVKISEVLEKTDVSDRKLKQFEEIIESIRLIQEEEKEMLLKEFELCFDVGGNLIELKN